MMDEHPLTWDELVRYHREVLMPDFKQLLRVDGFDERFDEMRTHFAEVCRRLDKLADDIHALNVWLDERDAIAAKRNGGK